MQHRSLLIVLVLMIQVALGVVEVCAGPLSVLKDDGEVRGDAGLQLGMEAPPPADQETQVVALASLQIGPRDGRADILAAIEREARRAGLPAEIAEAVTHTESGFNPRAVGADGEIGLMQILPSTARMLGFSGTLSELAAPDTNIRYGITYLARAWRLAGGDLCTAAMKYRAGHGETRFSHLSVDYCLKIRARLTSRGFPVSGAVPVATFGERARSCGRRCFAGIRSGGRVNFAAINDRLNQIVVRVSALKVR